MDPLPDNAIMSLEEIINALSEDQRRMIEKDLSHLLFWGWGEITFTVANKAVSGHKLTISKKYNNWKK